MRTIDADALADKVADLYTEGEEATEADKVVNDVIDLIDNAPTVERSQSEWILISERLPDRFEAVLVTFQIPNREPIVYRAVYGSGKFDLDNGDTWNWNDPEIKAWMPLPEPYKDIDGDNE